MNPYRKTPPSAPEMQPERNAEELILYGLLVAIGAIPVALALVQGGVFGAEPTVGMVMLSAGLIGMVLYMRMNRRARHATYRDLLAPEPGTIGDDEDDPRCLLRDDAPHTVDELPPGGGSRRR